MKFPCGSGHHDAVVRQDKTDVPIQKQSLHT